MQHGAHKLHVQYYSLLQRFLFHSSLTQRQQRAVMLANAHTKDVCFCKPPPGGLIYMRDPDNSGWLEVRPNRRPIYNRHAFQMAFAVVCGPFKDPFRHSASEIPFRASLSPLKPDPCPLTMIFYAPRWSLPSFPSLPSALWPPLLRAHASRTLTRRRDDR